MVLKPNMTNLDQLPMRAALGQFREMNDDMLTFIKQCGVDDFQMNTPNLPGDERWEYEDIARWVEKANSFGLRWMAIENVPAQFYSDIMLAGPNREKQLQNMIVTARNMAKAGVPYLGYHFMPGGVWRTSKGGTACGGAVATAFDYQLAKQVKVGEQSEYVHGFYAAGYAEREYTADEMWDNYCWYLERMLPVCEEVGLKLALHPDDPPVDSLGGVARLFKDFENFDRAMTTFDSPNHGLDFCHGCWSEMKSGEGVQDALRYFGERQKLFYIHFRDVQGGVENFRECFLGEGNCDPVETIRTLKEVNFNGFLIPDHVPQMVDDTDWCHRGRAWTVGYIKGLIAAVDV